MDGGERIKDKIWEAYSDQKKFVLLGILPNAEFLFAELYRQVFLGGITKHDDKFYTLYKCYFVQSPN